MPAAIDFWYRESPVPLAAPTLARLASDRRIVREPRDLEAAFAAMGRERVVGLTVLADPMFISQRKQIADFALGARLPTAFARRENGEVCDGRRA